MNFDIYGPYVIPRIKYPKGKLIINASLSELRDSVASDHESLVDACGCYVFAMRAGRGYMPWYVGQAAKSKLLSEALNPGNMGKYNSVIAQRSGTPVLFLLPMLTPTGGFRKPTQKKNGELKAIDFLEEWLIGTALRKNPQLINIKQTHYLKNLHVVGLFNPKKGEYHSSSTTLKKAIF